MSRELPQASNLYHTTDNLEEFYIRHTHVDAYLAVQEAVEDTVILAPSSYSCTGALVIRAVEEALKGTPDKPVSIGLVVGKSTSTVLLPAVWKILSSKLGSNAEFRKNTITVKRDKTVVATVRYHVYGTDSPVEDSYDIVLAENVAKRSRTRTSLDVFTTTEELREAGFDTGVIIAVNNVIGKLVEAPDVVLGTSDNYLQKNRRK